MEIIKTSQTPENAMRHAINIASATPADIELGRILHQAAFISRGGLPDHAVGEFRPAPIYLEQAMVLHRNQAMRVKILANLEQS